MLKNQRDFVAGFDHCDVAQRDPNVTEDPSSHPIIVVIGLSGP